MYKVKGDNKLVLVNSIRSKIKSLITYEPLYNQI